jgi:hypothetical protein
MTAISMVPKMPTEENQEMKLLGRSCAEMSWIDRVDWQSLHLLSVLSSFLGLAHDVPIVLVKCVDLEVACLNLKEMLPYSAIGKWAISQVTERETCNKNRVYPNRRVSNSLSLRLQAFNVSAEISSNF